jgi:cytochrome c oxidase subunit 2
VNAPMNIQSALDPAGAQAAEIARLFWVFTWVCVAVYVVTIAFIAVAVFRGRRNAAPDVSESRERSLRAGVTAASVLTVLILFALLVASVATGGSIGKFGRDDPRQMEVNVTGHQWWWEVKYPDALNPSAQLTDANEIHIPIHTKVLLRLQTADVIHSIWIPNLHGKRDLIPGRVNKFWIEADRPGIYRAQCAEFCGLQHAHMALVVFAQTPEDFARWKWHASAGAYTPTTPSAIRGQQVFLGAPCGKCHNITGVDAYGTLGPDLTHIASRRTLGAGSLINNRGNLAGWIANAPAIKPGILMPPNPMSAGELQDLIAYLETLK